ncbi:unnamed protein product, partial [Adineta steineri]
MDIAFASERD